MKHLLFVPFVHQLKQMMHKNWIKNFENIECISNCILKKKKAFMESHILS